ncbi:MFS transporter [Nonomuraea sp. NPDC026600]|uniref:MFS transporter n=1 Tax=Nonomuraea sp. NPDC026600 TaxID=3155363 RepID=UPI00340CCB28
MWPLHAAGFTTAFGAHAIAANLGGFSSDAVTSLLVLGGLLALYDGAEVLLKPVFGSLANRIGAWPVLLGGLLAFAAASALYAVADSPGWLWAARLGQGAAASAFSPSASALVARLNRAAKRGRAFGSYGFYKSIGYTMGPLLGGVLVWAGGLRLLFTVMALLGAGVALWVALAVPAVPPLPRARQTVLDLARRLSAPAFLTPHRSPRGSDRRRRSASASCPSPARLPVSAPWLPAPPSPSWPPAQPSSSRSPDGPWTPAASQHGPAWPPAC